MFNESEERKKIYDKLNNDKESLTTLLIDILIEQRKTNSFFEKNKEEDERRNIEAQNQMKHLEKLIPKEFKNMLGPILNIK